MARPRMLNQLLANESDIKSRVDKGTTTIFRVMERPDLFNGFEKKYQPIEEGGTQYPPESKKVQFLAENTIKDLTKLWKELIDFTVSRDTANSNAKADVEVDGIVLLKDIPVTSLLFLEKQLTEIFNNIIITPTLDGADTWAYDEAAGLYKSGEIRTHRTDKVQAPIVKYDATDKHPAQTEMITKDVLVGYWHSVKSSGAMKATDKAEILERIVKLRAAIKTAREGANGVTEAPKIEVSDAIFEYLLQ